jgi:outer membrane protein assembly factor BamD
MLRGSDKGVSRPVLVLLGAAVMLLAPGCIKHKYDNPISKDTQQPDKVLFDTSIDDIEHGRYERARLTLQTMMNTYDTSEFMAKAKLAYADSWYREGGAHGLAQAEADYKDFILFYPHMEEAAEAQFKICNMQFQQMDKPDRDTTHARLAEGECKDVLQKYPNSKFAPDAAQKVRQAQEVLAEGEFKVGVTYHKRGGNGYFSAENRFRSVVDQYPLYSKADEALWQLADVYRMLGDKYENKQADAYAKIVKDYPLSIHADEAKAMLEAMHRTVPEADPVQMQRMRYELDNQTKRGLLGKIWGPFSGKPNVAPSAKSGTPQMETFKPGYPMDIPATATGAATTNEVTITSVNGGGTDVLDKSPDARTAGGAAGAAGTTAGGGGATDAAGAGNAAGSGSGSAAGAQGSGSQQPASASPNAKKSSKKPPKPPKKPAPKKKGTGSAPADSQGSGK